MDVQIDESPKSRRATGSTLLRMIKKQAQRSPHQPLHRQSSLHESSTLTKRRSTIVRADSFKKAISIDDNSISPAKPPSVNRDVEEFTRYHKDVKSAVRYFRIVVEKKIDSKVPDNITILLESVINIDDMLDSCLKLQATKGLEELRKTMQACISKLVKWGDAVLLKSSTSLDIDKGMDLLNALEKSIQELHDSAIPRLQKASLNRQIRESVLLLKPEEVFAAPKNETKAKLSKSHSDGSLRGVLEQKVNGVAEGNRRDSGISERSVNSDNSGSTTSESPPASTHFTDSGTCLSDHSPSITSVEDRPLAVQAWSPGLKGFDDLPGSPLSPAPFQNDSNTTSSQSSHREVTTTVCSSSSRTISKTTYVQTSHTQTTAWSVKTDKVAHFCEESQQVQHQVFQTTDNRSESLSSFGSSLERGSMDLSDSHSIEELDEVPEMMTGFRKTQIIGSVENTSNAKKKAFQVYIQVLGEYTKPSDEYLERTMSVNSVYDNYQDMRNYTVEKMATALQFSGEKTGTTLITTKIPMSGLQNRKQPLSPMSDSRKTKSLDYRSFPKLKKNLQPMLDEPKQQQPATISHATSESSLSSGDEECTPPLDSTDVSKFLVFREEPSGQILYGGVADALIVHATNSSKKDFVFAEAFITTYRAFLTCYELIHRLIYRVHRMKVKGHKRASQNAYLLLLRVIDDLVAPIPKNILDMLVRETHNLFSNGQLMFGKWIRDRIIPKSEMHYHSQESITFTTPETMEKQCSIFSFHSEDIAKQLTIQDAQYYSRIEIPEILSWGKAQNEDMAPNLATFTEHFNQVSYWVRTYILSFEKTHDREKVYNKFLKIMKWLRKFNNFNSLLAIFSALDCSAIRRLGFPKASTDTLATFSSLIESEGSFRVYRLALAEVKPPCIPYLGLILQDVTFTYIGNKDELPDGKVNFYKCWQLFQMLEEFRKFRISNYEFERDPRIMSFFAGFQNYLSEDELYDRSLVLKPRDR